MKNVKRNLLNIYQILYKSFGPQHWWPGETPFEIIIGAILTQNTNWQNVEKAIDNLKQHNHLTPPAIKKIYINKLAQHIRSSGYFNIKARRLKEFIKFLYNNYNGNLTAMGKSNLALLREQLLEVKGIGPETADSILLYALNKPVFVIDAYTKRIFSRHKFFHEKSAYHEIQDFFMKNLPNKIQLFNEYHALIVRLGKEYCKTKPLCGNCPISTFNHSIT